VEAGAVIAAALWVAMSLWPQVESLIELRQTGSAAAATEGEPTSGDVRKRDEFDPEQALGDLRGTCLVLMLLAAMLLCLLARWGRRPLSDYGIAWRPAGRQWTPGLFAVTLAWLPVFLVLFATQSAGLRTEERAHSVLRMLSVAPSWETWLWASVSAVVFAPIAEELLFRVILQSWLVQRLGRWWGLLIASVLFAAVHKFPDSLAIIPLALLLGYTYLRQFSFLAIVVAHALFNGTMLVLSALLEAQ
jgi:membrane protease YdiL (CAAX protease family)